jgi:hypothetical protein
VPTNAQSFAGLSADLVSVQVASALRRSCSHLASRTFFKSIVAIFYPLAFGNGIEMEATRQEDGTSPVATATCANVKIVGTLSIAALSAPTRATFAVRALLRPVAVGGVR